MEDLILPKHIKDLYGPHNLQNTHLLKIAFYA